MAAIPMTLRVIQGHKRMRGCLFKTVFVQLHSVWQDFNWRRASCGPSATAELLVTVRYYASTYVLSSFVSICLIITTGIVSQVAQLSLRIPRVALHHD